MTVNASMAAISMAVLAIDLGYGDSPLNYV